MNVKQVGRLIERRERFVTCDMDSSGDTRQRLLLLLLLVCCCCLERLSALTPRCRLDSTDAEESEDAGEGVSVVV